MESRSKKLGNKKDILIPPLPFNKSTITPTKQNFKTYLFNITFLIFLYKLNKHSEK